MATIAGEIIIGHIGFPRQVTAVRHLAARLIRLSMIWSYLGVMPPRGRA